MRTDTKTPWKSWKIKLRISHKRKNKMAEMESKRKKEKERQSTSPGGLKDQKKEKRSWNFRQRYQRKRGGNHNSRNPPE